MGFGIIKNFVYGAIAIALFGVIITFCCLAKKRKWRFDFRRNDSTANTSASGINYNPGSNIPPSQLPGMTPPSNPTQYPNVNPVNTYPLPAAPGFQNVGYEDPPPPYSQVVNGKPPYGFNVGSS